MPDSKELPLTSVILIAHEAEATNLEASIKNLLSQTAPLELIVVDENLSSKTEGFLKNYAQEVPQLKFVKSPVKSCGGSRNLGAQNAKGEFLLFVDSKVLLPPKAVARFCEIAAKTKGRTMLGARVVDDHGKEMSDSRQALLTPLVAFSDYSRLSLFYPQYRLSLINQAVPKKIEAVPAISGKCMFLAKKDFVRLHGFDRRYAFGADMDFCLRFTRAEGKIYFVPDLTVEVAGPVISDISPEEKARSLTLYFHENFGHAYPQPALWALYLLIWIMCSPSLALFYLKKFRRQ